MAKKNPTNADIVREVKVVQTTLVDHNGRISILERWKIGDDAVKEALKNYPQPNGLSKELIRIIALAVGAIVTLVGVIAVSNQ